MKKLVLIFVFVLTQHFIYGQRNFLDQPHLETYAYTNTSCSVDEEPINIENLRHKFL